MFSDIVQRFDGSLNALYRERDARRAQGLKVTDFVSGNVNQAGFIFPPAILKQALARGADRAKIYRPHPLGQPEARQAVRAYYQTQGFSVPTDQIAITPGTSLSYLYLFKLLANPGDEILCPRPSYPLLDSIADLCGIRLVGYRLLERARWEIDHDHLQSGITSKTRAIVLISPHSPTRAVATEDECAEPGSVIAAKHHLPVISDEVFNRFSFQKKAFPTPDAKDVPLLFTLNGASKLLALPGIKIGWIAVTGESTAVKKAVHALDMISDTFLPTSEAAQFALPTLFTRGKPFLHRYQRDVQKRAENVFHALKKTPGLSFIRPEGGFYVTLRIESGIDEEKIALELLNKEGTPATHPGYFYDLRRITPSFSASRFLTHLAQIHRSVSNRALLSNKQAPARDGRTGACALEEAISRTS